MTEKETAIAVGSEVHHKDHDLLIFSVAAIKKGWATIEDGAGQQSKSRIGDLTLVEYDGGTTRLNPNHDRYIKGLGVTPSGHSTYDIDDFVAREMRAVSDDADAQYELAASFLCEETPAKTQEEFKEELESRYAKLNNGMVRMNLGNRIRGVLNRKVRAAALKAAKLPAA